MKKKPVQIKQKSLKLDLLEPSPRILTTDSTCPTPRIITNTLINKYQYKQ